MFAGADQIEVFTLDLVHHGIHLGEAHDAGDHVAADHEGRHAVGEAAPDHEVAGVGEDAGVEARHVADKVIEAVSGHAAGAVQVDAAETFHDVGVVRDLEIGHDRLAEAFELDVLRVVLSDGHGGVDDVRDDHHGLQEFFLHTDFLGGKLVDARGVAGHFGLDLFGLVLLPLPHQLADLLGDGLAFGAEGFDLGLDLAVALVELQDLVDEREFAVLEFFADILADGVRILAYEFDVKHVQALLFMLRIPASGSRRRSRSPRRGWRRARHRRPSPRRRGR